MSLPTAPRTVWILAVGRFFIDASSFLMLFLTLYLTGPRGLSAPAAGLVAGAYGLGVLLGNLTGGRWGDRFGHRRVLVHASTVASVGVATVPRQPSAALAIVLPVTAYLSATASVSSGALSALSVARGDRRTAVAIGRAFSNAGFVVGPPLGAVVAAHSYEALFVLDGLMTMAVRFAVVPSLPGSGPVDLPVGQQGASMWRALRADHALLAFLPAVVLADIVYRQLYSTLPLHLRDAGEPVSLYTGIIALGSGLILALEIPVALRLRKRPAYPIIAAGYALLGLGMLGFGLPVSVAGAVIAMVLVTAGEILYKTAATAHVLDAAPGYLVGQYQGLYSGASTSGTMLAAPLGTAVYAAAPGLLWPLCFAVCAGAAGLVLRSRRWAEVNPGSGAARPRTPAAAPSAPSGPRP